MSTPQDEAVTKYLVMQAFASGRYIESKGKQSTNWQEDHFPSWNWEEYDYRVKAEEKWRAFKEGEAPIGAILKRKGANTYWLITYVSQHESKIGTAGQLQNLEILFDECDMSLDGGKTWQPCGVKVT